VAAALGDVVSAVDAAALTGDFADYLAGSLRAAISTGIWGWFDDDLVFIRPWGFELDGIRVPVVVWQGGQDRMVPAAHGEWLAAHLPGARASLLPEEGYLSIALATCSARSSTSCWPARRAPAPEPAPDGGASGHRVVAGVRAARAASASSHTAAGMACWGIRP
jgi:hypothetical protein